METAVNRDYSGEILLRVSPESGRFIVEEHKKNGVVSYCSPSFTLKGHLEAGIL
ncbi:MAG: hypothetical protein SPG84_07845 [Vescimonas sp.]|uniref:hypothetical protein n=1 Tax=Vescimonas sp. TaxID=2892404 RepID=UPI002A90A4F5|nr:hypothetical protein [Vescimonas sp.]MDY5334777.1 hypothetical protein [Vescimonas sp.]